MIRRSITGERVFARRAAERERDQTEQWKCD